jgi:hypothetical protein
MGRQPKQHNTANSYSRVRSTQILFSVVLPAACLAVVSVWSPTVPHRSQLPAAGHCEPNLVQLRLSWSALAEQETTNAAVGDTVAVHLLLDSVPGCCPGITFGWVYGQNSFGVGTRFDLLSFSAAFPAIIDEPTSRRPDSLAVRPQECIPLAPHLLICTWRLRVSNNTPSAYAYPIGFDFGGVQASGMAVCDSCTTGTPTCYGAEDLICNTLQLRLTQVPVVPRTFSALKAAFR